MSWKTIIIHLVVECQMETLRMLRLKLSVREYRLHVLFSLHEVWNYQSESIESERTVYTRAHTYKLHTKNSPCASLLPTWGSKLSVRDHIPINHTQRILDVPLFSLEEVTTGLAVDGPATIAVLHPAPPGHLELAGGELELDILLPLDLRDLDGTVLDRGGGRVQNWRLMKDKLPWSSHWRRCLDWSPREPCSCPDWSSSP